jgi:hypothetical protein
VLCWFADDDRGRGRDRRLLPSDRLKVGQPAAAWRGAGGALVAAAPLAAPHRGAGRADGAAGPHVIGWATGIAASTVHAIFAPQRLLEAQAAGCEAAQAARPRARATANCRARGMPRTAVGLAGSLDTLCCRGVDSALRTDRPDGGCRCMQLSCG